MSTICRFQVCLLCKWLKTTFLPPLNCLSSHRTLTVFLFIYPGEQTHLSSLTSFLSPYHVHCTCPLTSYPAPYLVTLPLSHTSTIKSYLASYFEYIPLSHISPISFPSHYLMPLPLSRSSPLTSPHGTYLSLILFLSHYHVPLPFYKMFPLILHFSPYLVPFSFSQTSPLILYLFIILSYSFILFIFKFFPSRLSVFTSPC